MANIEGAPAPDDEELGGPDAPPPGGGPGAPSGGLLASLRQQQSGPPPSAPGPGTQANAIVQLNDCIGLLKRVMMNLDPSSPLHRDVNGAIGRLSRHLGGQRTTPGAQMTSLQDMMRGLRRAGLLQSLSGAQPQGGRQPPMPSTPLPGA